MAANDSLIGEGLNPSPYVELLQKYKTMVHLWLEEADPVYHIELVKELANRGIVDPVWVECLEERMEYLFERAR